MTGIGLKGFLGESADDGQSTGGKFVGNWKTKGHIIYWLHTGVRPVTTWGSTFMVIAEYDEKNERGEKTGGRKRVMQYPRFNSPDPKEVHANQHFRDKDTDRMKVPPQRDVFLLLREYLRLAGKRGIIPLDQVVFEWENPKDRSLTQWRLGELSGLVKRGQTNFGHSIDTKYESIMLVCVDGEASKGVRIAREGKLLTEKIRELIRDQIDSEGVDLGDPTLNPYGIKCIYDKEAKSPMLSYRAVRFSKAEYTQEIYDVITSTDDLPDIKAMVTVGQDDDVKIRAAMEAACMIELPFDHLFGGLDARRYVYDGGPLEHAKAPVSSSAPAAKPAAVTRPGATPGAAKPPTAKPPGVRPPPSAATKDTSEEAAPAPARSGRRRLLQEPAPAPAAVMIPCDVCGEQMDEKAAVCPHCGAKYSVEPDAEAEAPPPKPAPGVKPPVQAKVAQPATRTGPKPPPKKAEPENPDSEPADAEYTEPAQATECFACQGTNIVNNRCEDCGQEQSDDIPF